MSRTTPPLGVRNSAAGWRDGAAAEHFRQIFGRLKGGEDDEAGLLAQVWVFIDPREDVVL